MFNVVQAEFSHVGGGEVRTLAGLLAQCQERAKDGLELALQGNNRRSGIKTVVRFHDQRGRLTSITRRYEKTERRDREIFSKFLTATELRRRLLDLWGRGLAGKSQRLRTAACILAAEELRNAIQTSAQVTVEQADNRFRPMRRDEAHELLESAAQAKYVWLFIFKPNDLLADSNVPVAALM